MTTSSRKNYNYLALRGAGVDDMEFVEQLGLDPAIAYTPKLTEAMLDLTYQQNIEAGMNEKAAMKARRDAEKENMELLKRNGM